MTYKVINSNWPGLYLPNGARAATLRLFELKKVLAPLRVPGFAETDGKAALLAKYSEHVRATANALYPDKKFADPLPEPIAREAAAKLLETQGRVT